RNFSSNGGGTSTDEGAHEGESVFGGTCTCGATRRRTVERRSARRLVGGGCVRRGRVSGRRVGKLERTRARAVVPVCVEPGDRGVHVRVARRGGGAFADLRGHSPDDALDRFCDERGDDLPEHGGGRRGGPRAGS